MLRYYFTLAILFALMLNGCAKRGAPPGGPEDKSPPRIVSSFPADGDTLVLKDSRIEIDFDEPVKSDETTVMIYPTMKDLFVRFYKKSLQIQHKTPLKENTTYTLLLTPNFSDRHGNRIGRTIEIAFSTGSVLDTLELRGNIIDGELFSDIGGTVVAVYSDSVFSKPPLRLTFSAENGSFKIRHLPYRSVWVFAGIGIGSELRWDRATKIAVPHTATLLPQNKKLTLVLARNDTLPPKIISTSASDSFTFRLKFDEFSNIDSIAASLDAEIWLDPADSTSVLARTKISPLGKSFNIRACDETYNCTTLVASVPTEAEKDTLPPNIIARKNEKILPYLESKISADEPFSAKISTALEDSAIPFDTVRISPNALKISFPDDLPKGTKISLALDSLCDDFGNCTSDTITFSIPDEKLGDVSVSGIWHCDNSIVFLRSGDGEKITLNKNGVEFIRSVPGGRYTLWRVCDENGDGKWTSGKLLPTFRYSEEMQVFSDTVSVRPGWETEIKW